MPAVVVCALYKFVHLENYAELREPLQAVMRENGVRGALLLAKEGINGTIAGSREGIDTVLAWLQKVPALDPLETKESFHDSMPFARSKVKLKKEIVTMGVEGIDPRRCVGTYVAAKDWNRVISDPDVLVVDARNHYEVEVGTFRGALNPNTTSFREFPQFVRSTLDPQKHRKVAMFCTGGIRCEKSTAYLRELGFDEVYHLKGGILKYLEEVPPAESLWEGDCYVFDERVAVTHDLRKGEHGLCHACRYPLDPCDLEDPRYVTGVSCPRCYDALSASKKERLAERERQMELARKRGENHIGSEVAAYAAKRKAEKLARKEESRRRSLADRAPQRANHQETE
jgi:UPF0176 protein